MAKRFTATEKWADPWFCSLSTQNKVFWMYLLDTCDMAGIWQVNWPLVCFHIPGFDYDANIFGNRVQEITPQKWHIPKFLDFQYGELQPTNRMHLSILHRLEKEGVSTPLKCPSQGAKDKDREKVKESLSFEEKEEKQEREPVGFSDFWSAYPKRRSRGQALKAWRNLKPSMEQVSRIIAAINRAKRSTEWAKDGGQFIPYPATWLNAQGWEDEIRSTQSGVSSDPASQEALARKTAQLRELADREWEKKQMDKQVAEA